MPSTTRRRLLWRERHALIFTPLISAISIPALSPF